MTFRQSQRGFTLIEVVVAFAIFALCAGALYESFRGATRRSGVAVESELALLTAQSKLSELRVSAGPWPAEQSGKDAAGTTWRIEAKPIAAPVDPHNPWRLYEITVHAFGRGGAAKAVTLNSVELAKVEP